MNCTDFEDYSLSLVYVYLYSDSSSIALVAFQERGEGGVSEVDIVDIVILCTYTYT